MSDELSTRRARSRYRQLRLTATLETTGRLTYSVYAKPLNVAWSEHQCLQRGVIRHNGPLMTQDDVCAALVAVLLEQTLPGV